MLYARQAGHHLTEEEMEKQRFRKSDSLFQIPGKWELENGHRYDPQSPLFTTPTVTTLGSGPCWSCPLPSWGSFDTDQL